MRTVVFPGVLRPPSDMRLLAAVMRNHGLAAGAQVLDVFTGSGALAVEAALVGASNVVATDVSRLAALNARLNARLNRVSVDVRRGDLFDPVAGERFDLMLANPPYLPGEGPELPRRGPSRAWEGGIDGRALIDRFCIGCPDQLMPGGSVLMVHSSLCGERRTLILLEEAGLHPEVVARRRGPLGPIASHRAEILEQRGLLDPGVREEELLVFHGRSVARGEGLDPRVAAGHA
jgi:release factor glutamine methyltransferase